MKTVNRRAFREQLSHYLTEYDVVLVSNKGETESMIINFPKFTFEQVVKLHEAINSITGNSINHDS